MIPGRDDLQLDDRTMEIAGATTKEKKKKKKLGRGRFPDQTGHYLLQARLLASVVSPTAEDPTLVARGTCSTPRPHFS